MTNDPLFTPTTLGAIRLPSRVAMAPMTRNRASHDGRATPLMATYYAQRASAALIVTEMTHVAPDGQGALNAPGLHDTAQAAAWAQVVHAVHDAGGRIVLQLAHAGRASHPSILPDEAVPVAPSPIRPAGTVFTASGPQPFVTPRELQPSELPRVVRAFADATRLARIAGFDGVEIHAGNGYLIDQFLRDGSNRRRDGYGGTAANRARLLLEILEEVSHAWAPDRVGVRISPFNGFNDMSDSDPAVTFTEVARRLAGRGLAYLHVVEPPGADSRLTPVLRRAFAGPVVANGGIDARTARALVAAPEADVIAFGSAFIANPDLPSRLARGLPLAAPDPATFYGGGDHGYTDYPPLREAA